MSVEEYGKPGKKVYIITAAIIIIILALCYFGYYKYEQGKLPSPEGFSVEINSKDLSAAGRKWLEGYTEQYRSKYAPRSQRVAQYSIDNLEIKETNVVQVDFSVVTKKLKAESASKWNGVLEKDKVKCQWVLWFKEEASEEGGYTYTLTKLQRPAGYDLEKYQTSGQKERDEYKQKYEAEIPYEKQQYTYKIENKICYVSYNGGNSWTEVPVSLEDLVEAADGRAYYNKLQEKSYVITQEKTAFVYGGTRELPLTVTYSDDMGKTWNKAEINKDIDSARLRFLSFPTASLGYAVLAGGRVMSQESQVIYKTTDGGASWSEVGAGPRTSLLQSAGFIDENVGFMTYPKIEGAKTNFYRTEDGGKTFEPVILPVVKQEWMGSTFEPFVQPEIPYIKDGKLLLLVGQGPQGDFKGGRLMAKFKSEDKGKTWTFVELVEPPSEEAG